MRSLLISRTQKQQDLQQYPMTRMCLCSFSLKLFSVTCPQLVKYNTGYEDLHYQDFELHSRTYKCFAAQDFSWSIHGYSQIKQFYAAEAADMIDETFKCIRNLTYERFAHEELR